ncbi:MAG TPA: DNA-3-methyladenine glycosylase [Nitrososphaerales archaeon]|nr:DNA-3-methyladenine glycosylase [Nitrososphaerales archaeon]
MRLGREFFQKYTPLVARGLLGCRLVRVVEDERLSGIIVETEAYRGRRDPASHAFRGKTSRNEVMFGPAGCAYVYFVYGNNWCLNVTTESEGIPGAVLIRAIEPLEGIPYMRNKRKSKSPRALTNGPGNLTQAMGVSGELNGVDMTRSGQLFIEVGPKTERTQIAASSRVGVTAGKRFRWRFYLVGNPFVSK